MLSNLDGWLTRPGSPVSEALAMVRQVDGTRRAGTRLVLGYTPVARMNPFQAQLYRAFPEMGIAAAPVNVFNDYGEIIGLKDSGIPAAIHLHWLNVVLTGSRDIEEARRRLDSFVHGLEDFKAQGGRVVWTVHNRLPHDAVFPELELHLRTAVAELADVIHVMTPGTLDALRPDLVLTEGRTVVIPHPDYSGCYPDHVGRVEARFALEIEPDEFVFVLFGAIKPYKGLSELLDAFGELQRSSSRRVRLLVAGKPDESQEAADFVRRCEVNPGVLIAPRQIRSEHVQIYLRAADIGLAPYRRVLNSGAVVLFNTFGLPTIVPDDQGLLSSLTPGTYLSFGNAGLSDALRAAVEEGIDALADAVSRSQGSTSAESVSRSLASVLLDRVVEA